MSPVSNSAYSPDDDAQRLWPSGEPLSPASRSGTRTCRSSAARIPLFAMLAFSAFMAVLLVVFIANVVPLGFSPPGWLWAAGLLVVLPLVVFAFAHVWHAVSVRNRRKGARRQKRRTFM